MQSSKLTIAAGYAISAIAVLHTLVFLPHPYWKSWLAGGLRDTEPHMDSVAVFWALPGGFVVPLFVLGLLVIRMGRRGETAPLYIPIGTGLWIGFAVYLVGVSGFLLGVVPVVLLLLARFGNRANILPSIAEQSLQVTR